MGMVSSALALLLTVVVSGAVARALPLSIPLPLVQIGLGVVLTLSVDLAFDLNPDVFFLLFLPPLLFLDGWRIPKQALLQEKRAVLELALGLVLLTVLGLGLFIHWMIPAMPLAVAFALAAVLSPTDPVAVSAIGARIPIPSRLMHILEGESLLNDAAGLVCMRFAVAAVLSGAFSPLDAVATFLWLAGGGLASGVAVVWSATIAKNWVARRVGEEPGSQIVISLILPFAAYILAEHLGCSGILAAVSAGLTMSYLEQSGQATASTRIRRTAVWDALQFAVNGIIFVLLGAQLPTIVAPATWSSGADGVGLPLLLAYVVAICLTLAFLRYLWVWLSLSFTMLRSRRSAHDASRPGWRLTAVASLAGVRGAVTLAGVLTLPLSLNDGTPFPMRDLACSLAAGTIVISLISSSLGLPLLLRGMKMPESPLVDERENRARTLAAEAAIEAIGRARDLPFADETEPEVLADAQAEIVTLYRSRIEGWSKIDDDAQRVRRMDHLDRELRLLALRAERNTMFRLARTGQLPDDLARRLVGELDLLEARHTPK